MTTSFRTELKIFGREKELREVIQFLGVPNYIVAGLLQNGRDLLMQQIVNQG